MKITGQDDSLKKKNDGEGSCPLHRFSLAQI
jgi:hypothetical protein